ncbi:hypothetical protein ACFSM5_08545 [Lacibacterium aquatile]|uniref:Uncharacterized protein n=1 Tax=Lacibacterium aquatile TaxID=1168082 RepID=A0ABW5DP87_9PROT
MAHEGAAGKVVLAQGDLMLLRSDISLPLPAGQDLQTGDRIETLKGMIGIVLADRSVLVLGPDSVLQIDEVSYTPEVKAGVIALSVLSGRFTLLTGDLAPTASDVFLVHTPAAHLGLRGTKLTGEMTESGGLTVALLADPADRPSAAVVTNGAGSHFLTQVGSTLQIEDYTSRPALQGVDKAGPDWHEIDASLAAMADYIESLLGYRPPMDAEEIALFSSVTGIDAAASLMPTVEELLGYRIVVTGPYVDLHSDNPLHFAGDEYIGRRGAFGEEISRSTALPLTQVGLPDPIDATPGKGGGGGEPVGPYPPGAIVGTAYDDTLEGTAGRDSIYGLESNDKLYGNGGADLFWAGSGNDVIIVPEIGSNDASSSAGKAVAYEFGSIARQAVAYEANGEDGHDTLAGRIVEATHTGGTTLINAKTSSIEVLDLNVSTVKYDQHVVMGKTVTDIGIGETIMSGYTNHNLTVTASETNSLTFHLNGIGMGGDDSVFANKSVQAAFVYSGAGWDMITTGDGQDTLIGGTGADTMIGGLGNDLYEVDDIGDDVIERGAAGKDTVRSYIDYTLVANTEVLSLAGTANLTGTGNGLDNLVIGNAGRNLLLGDIGDDTLSGGAGNDTLIGGAGDDLLSGGTGNDLYRLETVSDAVSELAGEGQDTVQIAHSYTLGANVEVLSLLGSANLNGTGDGDADTIIGNSGDNKLFGMAGNDALTGGAGHDTLDGGAGADAMSGGSGDDLYVVDDLADRVVEAAGMGTDTVRASVDVTLSANVEVLSLTGSSNLNGTGDGDADTIIGNSGNNKLSGMAGNDVLSGGAGDDTLDGGAGVDTMSGGIGNDLYIVNVSTDTIVEAAGEGTDTVRAGTSYSLGANVEVLSLTGSGNISGTGDGDADTIIGNSGNNALSGMAGNDVLSGGVGNDTLDGGAGVDTMSGGTGNDLYIVDDGNDLVIEGVGQGSDTIQSSTDFTLVANVEVLSLTGAGNLNGTGDSDADTIIGNLGDNKLSGMAGNDVLSGGAGSDTLDGGAGIDTLVGGIGNDFYIVDNAGDVLVENAGEGTDTVAAGISYTLSGNIEVLSLTGTGNISGTGSATNDTIIGNAGDNKLSGMAGNDVLSGGDGNDTLDGGTGVDRLSGGLGNDLYVVDDSGDLVVELAGEGTDTVLASDDFTLVTNVEVLSLTGSANINGTGDGDADTIIGNSGDNKLSGMAGNDVLSGGAGDDTLDGGVGADTMSGGVGDDFYVVDDAGDMLSEAAGEGTDTVAAGISYTLGANVEVLSLTGSGNIDGTGDGDGDTIIGNSGDNKLSGMAGNDVLSGGTGDDTIDGGAGVDTMSGGIGDDLYVVDDAGDLLVELAGEGTDTVQSSISYTLSANVEVLSLTGSANINGTGDGDADTIIGNSGDNKLSGMAGNDVLSGGAGNDTLDGGAGVDSLSGGTGDDLYIVDDSTDVTVELAGEGIDTIQSTADYTLTANIEVLSLLGSGNLNGTGDGDADTIIGNSGDNKLSGMAGDDVLSGGAGDDTLDGGVGVDTMVGGTGDDFYVVDDAGDVLVENAGEGIDTVAAGVSYTLSGNIEVLSLTGSGNIDGTGSNDNDTIVGNSGDNKLSGMAGDDVLSGGAGSDTLDGGAGIDTLVGGTGDDFYVVDDAGDVLVENAGEGTDTVAAGVSYTLSGNVEVLSLTGSGNIDGTGSNDNNTIIGNAGDNKLSGMAGDDLLSGGAGNDTLDGGLGVDTMSGGIGDDLYIVDGGTDLVVEAAGEGSDTILSSADYTLVANVEVLSLTGSGNLNGTGDGDADTIIGNSGDNKLSGMAGNDVLSGGAGDDTLDGGVGADTMSGGIGDDFYVVDDAGDVLVENAGEGIDTVAAGVSYTLSGNLEVLSLTGSGNVDGTGSANNDTIIGNSGDNKLSGMAGDDMLSGGAGNDTLDGGAGIDTMSGGIGDDLYVVDDSGDLLVELAGEGTDTVQSSISYTLTANVEVLSLTGSANIDGTGDGDADTIIGNSGDNKLSGMAGDDVLSGGAGNDTLDGGAGVDSLSGGTGDDLYLVDDSTDVTVELAGEGIDTIQSTADYTLTANIEVLSLLGSGNLNGTGDGDADTIIGNSGDNKLSGMAGNDVLSGGAGDDTLDGGVGADTMSGGTGDDFYVVDDAGDVLVETAGEGIDTVAAGISFTLGANVEVLSLTGSGNIDGTGDGDADTIIGNSGDNKLSGMAGDDVLSGGAGNDTLDGGAGLDTMSGGIGDDLYSVDDLADVVVEAAGEGQDTLQVGFDYTLMANVEVLSLTGSGNINGTGDGDADTIIGNTGDNKLSGMAGDDVLSGGAGNDTLDGGLGIDTMSGGIGNDLYLVDDSGDVIVELGGEGTDTVHSSASYTLSANVEVLSLLGSGNIDGTGDGDADTIIGNIGDNILSGAAGNDVLTGAAGNDTLDGGLGADTMSGGVGDDVYVVDDAGDVVVELPGEGNDTVQTSLSYTLAADFEGLSLTGSTNASGIGNSLDNIIIGNSGNNLLSGGVGDDTLDGGAGNDTLSGGAGTDSLHGGAGNDAFYVDDPSDIATEAAGEGIDTVYAGFDYTIGANIEGLSLTGTGDFKGTGNAENNTIWGNSGDNLLSGDAGSDILVGGAGADTLDGGTGADTLSAGTGSDIYIVDDNGDVIVELSGEGTDTIYSSATSYTMGANTEIITLVGTGNIGATGNTLDNLMLGNTGNNAISGGGGKDTISGGDGNDTLDGGTGDDTLIGGTGNDYYVVDSSTDVVIELSGEGDDTIEANYSYTLSGPIENLVLSGGSNINGTGSAIDNKITGNTGSNVLSGGDGDDTLDGGAGDDSLYGGNGTDVLSGGFGGDRFYVDDPTDLVIEYDGQVQGIDTVYADFNYTLPANVEVLSLIGTADWIGVGTDAADTIWGNSGNNDLSGKAGDDYLDGGAGKDSMSGGLGNDTYFLDDLGDVVVENAGEGKDLINVNYDYTLGANFEDLNIWGPAIRGIGNELDNNINGNVNDNYLWGGDGNDSLDGLAGIDTMEGGLGDDVYNVDDPLDVIIENVGEGTDSVNAAFSYTLSASLEYLALTGLGNTEGVGNNLGNLISGNLGDNTLKGMDGNDTLFGGGGSDTLIGGTGDDYYTVVKSTNDTIIEVAGEGNDTVLADISFTLVGDIEVLTLIGTADLHGTGSTIGNIIWGNSGNNVLSGEDGNDTLNGGDGNDTLVGGNDNDSLDGSFGDDAMSGGTGDDIYIVDSAGDVVVELAGEGTDTLVAFVNYTVGANIEVISFGGSMAISVTGNALNNLMVGNANNNTLNGGAGDDTMDGGAGADLYYVDSLGDVVVDSFAGWIDSVVASVDFTMQGSGIEVLSLSGSANLKGIGSTGFDNITGNSGDNLLDGDTGNDTLVGGAGNDTLSGGTGVDRLDGGSGDDLFYYEGFDTLIEAAGGGNDTVVASENYTLLANFENLSLGGAGNYNGGGNTADNVITGNGGNNQLSGAAGNDTLSGGAGNDSLTGGIGDDVMDGGLGNDLFSVDSAADVIVEAAGEGSDTVVSAISFTLTAGQEIEVLSLSGSGNIDGAGNAADNTLIGNGGNNSLNGGGGADTLSGGAGNDTLDGGAGADVLNGGTGADTFVFKAADLGSDIDTVAGFTSGTDKLQIEIAGLGAGALSASQFLNDLASNSFNGSGGNNGAPNLIVSHWNGSAYDANTYVWLDADGSGAGTGYIVANLGTAAVTHTDIVVS